jgi:dCMP deaminase
MSEPLRTLHQQMKEETLRDITKLLSRLGTCSRAQVGCLIVKNSRIISTGFNGSPPGTPHCTDIGCQMEDGHCIRTTHAEANAIAFAAKDGISTDGATMYVYGWDGGVCHRCNKLALSAGIKQIIVVPKNEEENSGVCV